MVGILRPGSCSWSSRRDIKPRTPPGHTVNWLHSRRTSGSRFCLWKGRAGREGADALPFCSADQRLWAAAVRSGSQNAVRTGGCQRNRRTGASLLSVVRRLEENVPRLSGRHRRRQGRDRADVGGGWYHVVTKTGCHAGRKSIPLTTLVIRFAVIGSRQPRHRLRAFPSTRSVNNGETEGINRYRGS